MPLPLFVEESGRTLRLNAAYDMTAFTELSILFCKPGGTSVTKATADGVSLGTVNVTDDDLGALLANQYIEYQVEVGLILEADAGQWSAQLIFTNTGSVPDTTLYGTIAFFTVSERCDT